MIISEVIKHLEALKTEHGDIKVCIVTSHEYWGSLYNEVSKDNIFLHRQAKPLGPKSGKSEPAIVFNNNF